MISSARQDKYYSCISLSFTLSISISLVTLREGMGKSFIPRRASRDHDILPRPPRPRSRAIHPDFSRVNTPFPLGECFFSPSRSFFSIRRCPVNLRGILRGLSILCRYEANMKQIFPTSNVIHGVETSANIRHLSPYLSNEI